MAKDYSKLHGGVTKRAYEIADEFGRKDLAKHDKKIEMEEAAGQFPKAALQLKYERIRTIIWHLDGKDPLL